MEFWSERTGATLMNRPLGHEDKRTFNMLNAVTSWLDTVGTSINVLNPMEINVVVCSNVCILAIKNWLYGTTSPALHYWVQQPGEIFDNSLRTTCSQDVQLLVRNMCAKEY